MRTGSSSRQRDTLLTVLTVILVPSFLALGYWQLTRALGGNTLSWAYTFEWPLFAGYLIYIRRRLLHEATAQAASAADADTKPDTDQPMTEAEDEELAAYNRYLAELEESGRRKHW
jgi:hypothetical protein